MSNLDEMSKEERQRQRNSELGVAYYKRNRERLDNIQKIRRLFKYIPDMDMKRLREMYDLKDDEETKQALEYLREKKKEEKAKEKRVKREGLPNVINMERLKESNNRLMSCEPINKDNKDWKIQLRPKLRNRIVSKCKELGLDYKKEFKDKYENMFLCYVMFRKIMKSKYNLEYPSIEYLSEGLLNSEELEGEFRKKLNLLKNEMLI